MILLIDNYDSFTYNLFHFLREVGADVQVHRNDTLTMKEIEGMGVSGIVLSPGPCTPNEAGICLDIVHNFQKKLPILGVCLGHQAIGQAFGGKIVRGEKPMHAVISDISHSESPLFTGIPDTFKSTRYHSLIIDRPSLPPCLKITAESEDGVIQGIQHETLPLFGVQFHPESIASENGHDILRNFLGVCESQ
ncbi:MAG: anthranilate synthase component 2 [Candidatus Marinamargulisbacteria bacterium]|jgi:anthranilate synthase component 2